MGFQTDADLRVRQEGLQDRQRVEVRLSSLASHVSLSLQSVSAIGPAHDASHFCILSHLF